MDIHAADSGPASTATVPDAHKLAVYHVAVAFQAAAMRLLPKGHDVLVARQITSEGFSS